MRHLGTVVSDLLDVARVDYGLFRVEPAAVELAPLLEDCARSLATPDTSVDVRVQSTGKIVVLADAVRLRQCVDNVVANAVAQSPKGGIVTILIAAETRADGEYARIDVIDEGPGVPPDMLPRIFERLATGKARQGGLGLGLYLAKRIAELHGGDLTAQSTPGKGARFTLSVPCRIESAGAPAEASGPHAVASLRL